MKRKKFFLILFSALFGWIGAGKFYIKQYVWGTIKLLLFLTFICLLIYIITQFLSNKSKAIEYAEEKSQIIDNIIDDISEKTLPKEIENILDVKNFLIKVIGQDKIDQGKKILKLVSFLYYFKTIIILAVINIFILLTILISWIIEIISSLFKSKRFFRYVNNEC
ncbi:NINE protein [[Mycoplasma] collis]|uniref:NINE protein n=1 Tax=[Mycoplasma] collis TaxID=2127 RepID=UPI00051C8DF3|nr:NINE protein [[Mycoplasma] collis]